MPNLLDEEFNKVFKGFVYPFESSNQIIFKMSQPKRNKYLREAAKINESDVLIQELNEICRHFYHQLAMLGNGVENNELRSSYRGALLFAQKFKKRFAQLAQIDPLEYEEQIKKTNSLINEIYPE
jgi:hypothetical protein